MRQTRTTLLLLVVACAGQYQNFAASPSLVLGKTLSIQDDLADKPLPQWRDGVLVVLDSSHGSRIGITVYDRNGQRTSNMAFAVPGATYVTVRGFSRGTDGAIALCGSLTDGDGRAGAYVGWISAAGTETQVIRTSPFVAWRVAVAADGTIWTQGSELRPRAPGEASRKTFGEAMKGDAAVFRQFSRSGKMLRAVVPQSEIVDPNALNTTTSVFEAVGGRIVWYSDISREYIAISPDGSVARVKDVSLPNNEKLSGSGINGQGEIFASSVNGSTWSVSRLDLGERAWTPIASGLIGDRSNPHHRLTLLGSDGEFLVAGGSDSHHLRLFLINK